MAVRPRRDRKRRFMCACRQYTPQLLDVVRGDRTKCFTNRLQLRVEASCLALAVLNNASPSAFAMPRSCIGSHHWSAALTSAPYEIAQASSNSRRAICGVPRRSEQTAAACRGMLAMGVALLRRPRARAAEPEATRLEDTVTA
jgi:hypothetical protein